MPISNCYIIAYQQPDVNREINMIKTIDENQRYEEGVTLVSEDEKMDLDQRQELKTVTIEVNSHKVKMRAGPATGLEVKEAAIKQGVEIQQNFVLQLELPNGTGKIIGDDDKISLRDHMSFTAIEPDDNS